MNLGYSVVMTNSATQRTNDQEFTAMSHTFAMTCTCCGEQVTGTDEGFAATSVSVTACTTQRRNGVASTTWRKSAALAAATGEAMFSHAAGFVRFAG